MAPNDRIILRDLAIFQVKLLLDGVKDIVLAPLAGIAALVDVLKPGNGGGQRFYAVIRLGERFDRWLNLYSAAEKAGESEEGLLGGERAPADSMLGHIESMLFDREDDEAAQGGAATNGARNGARNGAQGGAAHNGAARGRAAYNGAHGGAAHSDPAV